MEGTILEVGRPAGRLAPGSGAEGGRGRAKVWPRDRKSEASTKHSTERHRGIGSPPTTELCGVKTGARWVDRAPWAGCTRSYLFVAAQWVGSKSMTCPVGLPALAQGIQ